MIDDGEVTRFVHDRDGEERHGLSLVLFSHSVSESELLYCNWFTISFRLLFKFVLKIFCAQSHVH